MDEVLSELRVVVPSSDCSVVSDGLVPPGGCWMGPAGFALELSLSEYHGCPGWFQPRLLAWEFCILPDGWSCRARMVRERILGCEHDESQRVEEG